MYPRVRPLLFHLEPERAHDVALGGLAALSRHPALLLPLRQASRAPCHDPRLAVTRWELGFPNPVGLAAGMDKNARALPAWAALGFGFAEVGSVTAFAQPGNPRPRLIRLPRDEAIINRMGFNNEGAEAVAARLARLSARGLRPAFPIGINLGKSKATPLEDAPADYLRSLELLYPHGDYFVLNVSSPNTPGLRDLQAREPLAYLLSTVSDFARRHTPKPILIKIAPDLSFSEMDGVLEVALRYGVAGVIATNTTVSRDALQSAVDESGGLSGRPLAARSLAVLRHLRQTLGSALPIVSVGGILTPDDAVSRLEAGASLVQLYTGLVYRGPGLIPAINRAILGRLEARGMTSLEDLIGAAA